MSFFERPILNSPYFVPDRHWELEDGRPTDRILPHRRKADLISAIPGARSSGSAPQGDLGLDHAAGLSTSSTEYNQSNLNELRQEVDTWRRLPNPSQWGVSPVTQRLLQHWRALQADESQPIRPFFCQLEAVETAIWLAEVAPKGGSRGRGRRFLGWLEQANAEANPELFRIALKLATGAGKTTVMAMLIAWQTLNAVRSPNAKRYSKGFLIVAPGITIKDRLRVLQPNDTDSYYASRSLVPTDLLPDLGKARIVITNYHAFKRRETQDISKGGRAALAGHGEVLDTLETEGQMLQRVMKDLMGMKNIVVINDEAHHCYRERPGAAARKLSGDERKEAEANAEAARLWISGIEAAKRLLGVPVVYDLSATPFFLAGSGYVEGTLFPWVVSDFSLMDAIECGIVKLPRVPVADNVPGRPEPMYRNLWREVGKRMPKKAKGQKKPNPADLPLEVQAALDALYGHYEKTYEAWEAEGVGVPPVFIVVCNNTTNSEMLRDYIAGYERESADGEIDFVKGKLGLFHNYDDYGERLAKPRTILIDSATLEAGGDIDKAFRDAHAAEIEAFRREQASRGQGADVLADADILREVMNTIGRKGRLGEQVRCVVSVSMLTEGWDANNVTHIFGLRAFGTRLICEQVIGRALRRLSYDLDPEPDPDTGQRLFRTEYADIMGIDGLNFSGQAVQAPVNKPRDVVNVRAMSPERDDLEITFPRVEGYRPDFADDRLTADFSKIEPFVLTPEKVGAAEVKMSGIVGEPVDLTLEHLGSIRRSTIQQRIAAHLVMHKLRDADGRPRMGLFPKANRIVKQWLDADLLVCEGGTMPAQALYKLLTDDICDRILGGLSVEGPEGKPVLRAILDPYNPTGSTADVNFNTSAPRWQPRPDRSHINYIVTDSEWEEQLARLIEDHHKVLAYAKNHNLGFEIPYRVEGEAHRYRPDFLIRLADPDAPEGGETEPLTLIIEVKGFRDGNAAIKAAAAKDIWVPAVNALGRYGRWGFAELRAVHSFREELDAAIDALLTAPATV
ncbi:BPTD_3080 family restriction endonuclease [Rhodovulum sp. DZ06]|uniref:BPTD_3080 family restriction endonuclease n=1 Tax=Rhodovulum sp. DZ06 TaxID=3425126 RepID=UPI003D32885C